MIESNLPHLTASTLNHYKGLPVQTTEHNPYFLEIVANTYRELTTICARYNKVIVFRVDLFTPTVRTRDGAFKPLKHASDINIKNFRKSAIRELERKYKSKVAYQWVREYKKSEDGEDRWHWHWWFAVKCSKDKRPHTQAKEAQDIVINVWDKKIGESPDNNASSWFYLERKDFSPSQRMEQQKQIACGSTEDANDVWINRNAILGRRINKGMVMGGVVDECFYTLTYLAKVVSKVRSNSTKSQHISRSSQQKTDDQRRGRQEEIERNLADIHTSLAEELQPIAMQTNTHD